MSECGMSFGVRGQIAVNLLETRCRRALQPYCIIEPCRWFRRAFCLLPGLRLPRLRRSWRHAPRRRRLLPLWRRLPQRLQRRLRRRLLRSRLIPRLLPVRSELLPRRGRLVRHWRAVRQRCLVHHCPVRRALPVHRWRLVRRSRLVRHRRLAPLRCLVRRRCLLRQRRLVRRGRRLLRRRRFPNRPRPRLLQMQGRFPPNRRPPKRRPPKRRPPKRLVQLRALALRVSDLTRFLGQGWTPTSRSARSLGASLAGLLATDVSTPRDSHSFTRSRKACLEISRSGPPLHPSKARAWTAKRLLSSWAGLERRMTHKICSVVVQGAGSGAGGAGCW